MTILELHTFSGKAQVLGAVREVAYSGDDLVIVGITLDEAHRILNHLAVGLESVTLPVAPQRATTPAPKQAKAVVEEEAEDPADDTPPPTKKLAVKKAPASPPKKPAADDGDIEDVLDAVEEAPPAKKPAAKKRPEPEAEEEVEELLDKAPPAKKSAAKKSTADDGLVERLAAFSRFQDVVAALIDAGIHGEEEIVAFCQRVKAQVRAINRVGDDQAIAERVPRVLVSLEDQA